MAQNFVQLSVTGTNLDGSTSDLTALTTWSVSDPTIMTVGTFPDGIVSIASAGKIWGGTVAVTATYQGYQVATGNILVVASDSGSVAPRMPQEDDHWRALGISPWGAYGGLQELGGNVVLSGSAGYTLTATNIAAYNGTASGWLRTGIVVSGTTSQLGATAGTGPNMSQSWALLAYTNLYPSSAVKAIVGALGTVNSTEWMIESAQNSNGVLQLDTAGTVRIMVGPCNYQHTDRVHPYLIVVDATNQRTLACTDDVIIISSSFAPAPSDTTKGIGGTTHIAGGVSGTYFYYASATGSVIEALASTSGAADFLSRLGWNVKWKDCPVDSGSIRLPFLPSHWNQLGLSPWTATWNLQEQISSLVSFDTWDGKSVNAWAMTANSIDQYSYRLPNWNRSGLQLTQAQTHRAFVTNVVNNSTFLFDPTGSFACLMYGVVSGSSTAGNVTSLGGLCAGFTAAGQAGTVMMGVSSAAPVVFCCGASSTGSQPVGDGKVHPFMLVLDKTNSRVKLYTDLESVTGSYVTPQLVTSVTGTLGFFGYVFWPTNEVACSGVYNYVTFCTGALAESFSDDGVASHFLKTLGWSIPW